MKLSRLTITVFVSFILLLSINACAKNLQPDEQFFKDHVEKLNNLLEGYFNISVKVTKNNNYSQGHNKYLSSITYKYDENDIKKREKYFNRNKNNWLMLDKALKDFQVDFPNSKWCDDASFYRVFESIIAKYPYKYWGNHTIESTKYFIENYKIFDIDKWTQKEMHRVFPVNWNDMIAYHGTSEKETIRAGVYSMLVTQYCMNKDFAAARATIKKIEKEKFSDKEFASGLIQYIELFKNKTTEK